MSDSQYTDFLAETAEGDESPRGAWGAIGAYGLHLVKAMFLAYSGYHGIHAALIYAGSDDIGRLAQIIGIIVLETVLASIYLAWHNQRITGDGQQIAAYITYGAGFILACLAIVGDSQLNAGMAAPPWLSFYLRWVLPLSPALMAAGAVIIHELAPSQLRRRRQAAASEALAEARHMADIARQRAELQAQRAAANLALNARQAVARQIADSYSSAAVQGAIRQKAIDSVPALMASVGIDMMGGEPAASEGAPASRQAGEDGRQPAIIEAEASPRPFGVNGGQA